MANNLKELLNRPLPRGNSTHAGLLAVIGGYLIYLAYKMVRGTLRGESSMSMAATVIFASIIGLGGLGAIGYGVYMWRACMRQAEAAHEEEQEEEE